MKYSNAFEGNRCQNIFTCECVNWWPNPGLCGIHGEAHRNETIPPWLKFREFKPTFAPSKLYNRMFWSKVRLHDIFPRQKDNLL